MSLLLTPVRVDKPYLTTPIRSPHTILLNTITSTRFPRFRVIVV